MVIQFARLLIIIPLLSRGQQVANLLLKRTFEMVVSSSDFNADIEQGRKNF